MWPVIMRENNIGKNFDPDFWRNWGPTEVKYLDESVEKKIQSIYCMYKSYETIKIDDLSSIAMVLTYECGEFGEHTIVFSYDKVPRITYNSSWDYCVFPDFDSEDDMDIRLYKLGVMDINIKTLSPAKRRNLYRSCFESGIIDDINKLDSMIVKFQGKKVINDLNSIFSDCRNQLTQKDDNSKLLKIKNIKGLLRERGDYTATKDEFEF